MERHNKILVPTDFSEQSTEALRKAGTLAATFNAEVHLLHISDPSSYFSLDIVSTPSLDDTDGVDGIHVLAKEADEFNQLKSQAESVNFSPKLHLETSTGSYALDICAFAKALPANLIVIARQDKKSVLEHMLVGATVERVVGHADCSVLVTMPHDLLNDGGK